MRGNSKAVIIWQIIPKQMAAHVIMSLLPIGHLRLHHSRHFYITDVFIKTSL
jgi:hypothetical protein